LYTQVQCYQHFENSASPSCKRTGKFPYPKPPPLIPFSCPLTAGARFPFLCSMVLHTEGKLIQNYILKTVI